MIGPHEQYHPQPPPRPPQAERPADQPSHAPHIEVHHPSAPPDFSDVLIAPGSVPSPMKYGPAKHSTVTERTPDDTPYDPEPAPYEPPRAAEQAAPAPTQTAAPQSAPVPDQYVEATPMPQAPKPKKPSQFPPPVPAGPQTIRDGQQPNTAVKTWRLVVDDDVLLDDVTTKFNHVNVIAPPGVAADTVVETLATHIQGAHDHNQHDPEHSRIMLVANFGVNTKLTETALNPPDNWYRAVPVSVSDVIEALPTNDRLDLVAAAAFEDVTTADTMAMSLRRAVRVLQDRPDPITGGPRHPDAWKLEELRDLLGRFGGERMLVTDETPTIAPHEKNRIDNALPAARAQENRHSFDVMAAVVARLAPTTRPELDVNRHPDERKEAAVQSARYDAERFRPGTNGATLVVVDANQLGGSDIAAFRAKIVLTKALTHFVSEKELPPGQALPEHGASKLLRQELGAVALTGVRPEEQLDELALVRFANKVHNSGRGSGAVPLIVEGTMGEGTNKLFLMSRVWAIGNNTADQKALIEGAMPKKPRLQETGATIGQHGNSSSGLNDGGSTNFDDTQPHRPKGAGTSDGTNTGKGWSSDVSRNYAVASVSVARPEDQDQIPEGGVALFYGDKALGVWDPSTRSRIGDFTPAADPSIMDALPSPPPGAIPLEAGAIMADIFGTAQEVDGDIALMGARKLAREGRSPAQKLSTTTVPGLSAQNPHVQQLQNYSADDLWGRRLELKRLYEGATRKPLYIKDRSGETYVAPEAMAYLYRNNFRRDYRGPDDPDSLRYAFDQWCNHHFGPTA